jgi:hypothetical protein
MIAEVLNREAVLQQMAEALANFRQPEAAVRRGEASPYAGDLGPEDYAAALAELEAAEARERAASSGQPPGDPDARRGATHVPIDDTAFISHDPVVSLFQSVLELAIDAGKTDRRHVRAPEADDGRRGADEPVVTDQWLEGFGPDRAGDGRRLFDRFSITDPNWVSSVFAMALRKARKRRPFPAERPPVRTIADNARLILVADWATGIPRARRVGACMRRSIEQGIAQGRECHVAHLGDVYYSGFESEYRKRFLKYWPVRDGEEREIGSWCLNGNHDMYAGGHAYFDFLLQEHRFKVWQGISSFVEMRNSRWQVLGLDTAWDDDGLKDPQNEWVKTAVQESGERRILMLSHHQLFSAHEASGDRGKALRAKLGFLLGTPRLRAWLWGHEHRCVVFEANAEVPWAACIGHGGVPVYMTLDEQAPLVRPAKYEYRKAIRRGLERWALMGHAVLDFAGDYIQVTLVDENGEEHYRDVIG